MLKLKSKIPTYLPLPDAARRYGLSEEALMQLVGNGNIQAVQLPTGEVLVAAESNGSPPKTKEQIITEEFAHLRGQWITVTEAVQKYNLHPRTISEWVRKGYVVPLKYEGRGSRMELDAAEVAYCAKIYSEQGGKRGVRLFDEYGNPYQLKRPQLAEYRRRKQQVRSK
jgi:hypothetical protein